MPSTVNSRPGKPKAVTGKCCTRYSTCGWLAREPLYGLSTGGRCPRVVFVRLITASEAWGRLVEGECACQGRWEKRPLALLLQPPDYPSPVGDNPEVLREPRQNRYE
jgi:hypothetical protein